MYAVNPAVRAAWTELFGWVSAASGLALEVIDHAAPAPLDELWRRGDLGLAFICGYPFASGGFPVQPVVAPVPASALGAGRPLYASHLVVRAESGLATLAESFGGRLGWTVEHSQSGFNALRSHLLPYRRAGASLYAGSVGPLVTPRRVIEALLAGEIDIGPLDSYFHDLLLAHEPETAARLRIVETTAPRPIPLLVASEGVQPAIVGKLRGALLAASGDAVTAPLLARLRLSGFAAVEREAYGVLLDDAREAEAAGYVMPG
ncbi:ABC transporter substrate-binding protein [Bosea caraganae]|uniref:ABC transporter substrate-binding protein n=2 Tax=Bosea caraganae TaxID=2763117 RepID=A0A370L0C5_9HYPH|nr:ABC transporter substrate-binding protein [Bosea caraganae]RDJ28970.1 ABC transporter substrate-binding protein [Bosea caraganae]